MNYAFVSGGSRGIGRATCVKLAEAGYNLLINYASNDEEAQKTKSLVEEKGTTAELMKFDVSKESEVESNLQKWIESNTDKKIEVLVNNAGIRRDNLLMWMSNDDWNRVMDISVDGFFFVTRIIIKDMLVKKYGRVVNIVSLSGLKGLPGQTNYSASKAAVI